MFGDFRDIYFNIIMNSKGQVFTLHEGEHGWYILFKWITLLCTTDKESQFHVWKFHHFYKPFHEL